MMTLAAAVAKRRIRRAPPGLRPLSLPPVLHQNETDDPASGVVARGNDDVVHRTGRSPMSAAIDGTAIDKVLRDAVDSGGVRTWPRSRPAGTASSTRARPGRGRSAR